MDRHFLKFWGEFLLQAAEGQRRLEDFTRWMQSGFDPAGHMTDLFRQCYDLPPAAPHSSESWRQALDDFHASLKAYAPLWGWVSLDRYEEVKKKVARLEKRIVAQEKQIAQLESLLTGGGMGASVFATRFQNLIEDQRLAFEKLVRTLATSPEGPDEENP